MAATASFRRPSMPRLTGSSRSLSLPHGAAAMGGLKEWNTHTDALKSMWKMLDRTCTATSVPEALAQVDAILGMGHLIWAYAYMRALYDKDMELFYATLLAAPSKLLPVVYTPTVGEACQKFGQMPLYPRGCYVSLEHKGNVAAVLKEYADLHLQKGPSGAYACDCIVFSDGGRILGLGDLGAWGMGIPIGKLDLYTVCAGVHPRRTIPVILDVGISGAGGNTALLDIRGHPQYTGLRRDRLTHTSEAGTVVNSAYYGKDNFIDEFMDAAVALFGRHVLLQFEDFNSNDAFPLLERVRDRYLTYNDDIQGTAAVTVAGILGGLRLRHPDAWDLLALLRNEVFLFHGAGSANLGAAQLLVKAAGVAPSRVFVTNSRGLIWRDDSGTTGSFRNKEQKAFAVVGRPAFPHADLVDIVHNVRPTVLVGAVGSAPGCFTKAVVEKMVRVQERPQPSWLKCWTFQGLMQAAPKLQRPIIFALSNPKTQAEVNAAHAFEWSGGLAIYGSGTAFDPVTVGDRTHHPGQVNNVYIFPGLSFGAAMCRAKHIPDEVFLLAAEAVASSLTTQDLSEDRVVPNQARIREVGLNVATATALGCQRLGIAMRDLGDTPDKVKGTLAGMMWSPARLSKL